MKLFKLTKGPISKIRSDKVGCEDLIKSGYILDGEVDEDFNPVQSVPDFGEDDLTELRDEAVSLGLAPSTAARIKKAETLREKIEELRAE